jgi:drug/metabolite transporter (DMT)-like permease
MNFSRQPASTAVILTNGEIVFTLVLSSIFFDEKPHGWIGLFAVILVVIGLVIATTEDLIALENILELNPGNIMILASMLMLAIDNNICRRLTLKVNPVKIAMVKLLAGGIVLVVIALAMGKGKIIAGIKIRHVDANNFDVDLWLRRGVTVIS